jgi:hypothetical protein
MEDIMNTVQAEYKQQQADTVEKQMEEIAPV